MTVRPVKEQVKAQKRHNMTLAPYTMIMLEYELD